MTEGRDVRCLLEVLAAHPVLPPAEALLPSDEALHALLADLARGEGSSHAELLRDVSAERAIPAAELARRAEFVLACLVLPASGTHYELLGVRRDATTQEVRKHWATLMRRYHPDRRGGSSGWLDGQARRLIEAYHTLKDPERRRAYDAELARGGPEVRPLPAKPASGGRLVGPGRWRWAPVGIIAVGFAVGVWAYTRPARTPLPAVRLPAAPKLLDAWSGGETGRDATARARAAERATTTASAASGPAGGGLARPAAPPPSPVVTGPSPAPAAAPSPPRPEAAPPSRTAPLAGGSGAPAPPALKVLEPPAVLTAPPPAPAGAPSSPRPDAAPPSRTAPLAGAAASTPPAVRAPEPRVAPPAPAVASRVSSAPATIATPGSPPEASAEGTARPGSPARAEPSRQPSVAASSEPSPPPPARAAAVAARPHPIPAPSAQPGGVSQPTVEAARLAEPLALVEAFRGAYERRDLLGMLALFGSAPRERDVTGRPALEQLYAQNFAALDDVRYELTQLEVTAPGGQGELVVQGRFRIRAGRVVDPARPVDVAGSIRWTLRREGGVLRIVGLDYDLPRP